MGNKKGQTFKTPILPFSRLNFTPRFICTPSPSSPPFSCFNPDTSPPLLSSLLVTLSLFSEAMSSTGQGLCLAVSLFCSFLLTFSCALLGVLYRLQSIQGSTGSGVGLSKGCSPFKAYTCSSMGTPWATVSLGICLLHRGAPPASLALLLPLFVTLLFPSPLWHFLPFLKYVFTEVSTT